MPKWNLQLDWKDKDIFIIGGGASLKGFDWNLLRSELTIGCNGNFILGPEICKICFFGDYKFFRKYVQELSNFATKGIVVTNHQKFLKCCPDWLHVFPRTAHGLHTDSLGWNSNTGASAINLALLFGAKKVYLLGFDMKLSKEKKNNWHDKGVDRANAAVFRTFLRNFVYVCKDWKSKFADREIINITDDSELNCFPKIGVKEFWEKRKNEQDCKNNISGFTLVI
jgi:hypothetical protein